MTAGACIRACAAGASTQPHGLDVHNGHLSGELHLLLQVHLVEVVGPATMKLFLPGAAGVITCLPGVNVLGYQVGGFVVRSKFSSVLETKVSICGSTFPCNSVMFCNTNKASLVSPTKLTKVSTLLVAQGNYKIMW